MFRSIVEAVYRHAELQPDKLCLADDNGSVTYAEYADGIARRARLLRDTGVMPGDCVICEAAQTIDYLALELAIQQIGAIFVPLEHNASEARIASCVSACGARLVIRESDCARIREEAAVCAPLIPETFPESDAVCEILFSTGTTGKEKGVVLTHSSSMALAGNVISGVGVLSDNVELIPSPMNHSHGLRRYYANMVAGATVVLLGSAMNMRKLFSDMDTYGVTAIDMVPSALSVALKLSRGRFGDYADRLRYIQLGAAPIPEADRLEICRLLPNTHIYNFYGSTESGCIAIYDVNRPNCKPRCVGRPTANADIFIVDDDMRPMTATEDAPGLLASRGGMNMIGYLNDAEETAKVLIGGAVYSNDLAYFDADGDIILMGRRGDVINCGGVKIAPEEIENAARELDDIADCGCVGVPDPVKGSVPRLVVQMKPGAAFDAKAIYDRLAKVLEPQKRPAEIVPIDKIPRTYNGKLLRRALRP